jgi:predicted nuclease of predicted toxin-antitoxin system
MRFKIDENLHDDIAALAIGRGHDAETVHAEGLRGCDDSTLAEHCRREDRVLITLDLDFADFRAILPSHPGTIVLRVGNQSQRHVRNVMVRVLDLLQQESVSGRLWIVSDAGVRIRGR